MENREKPKMKIVHIKEDYKPEGGETPIEIDNKNIRNIRFDDIEKDVEFKRLLKLLDEAKNKEDKEQIEFALRQLLLS
jgi:hypothetical protein